MAESVLADFVGTMTLETGDWESQTSGRVLLGRNQLAFARSADESVSVALSDVFDVSIGEAPPNFGPFAETPVTIAHTADDGRAVAVVAADAETVEEFGRRLCRTVLAETDVRVQHPARVGGRTTDADFRDGTLSVAGNTVAIRLPDERVEIDLEAITSFERTQRTVDGTREQVLILSHLNDGTAQTSVLTTTVTRPMSILGRYLRRIYDEVMASLETVSFSESKIEVLVTLYSTGEAGVDLSTVMDADPAEIDEIVERLLDDDLVEQTAAGPVLTSKGQVVANHYLERVNT